MSYVVQLGLADLLRGIGVQLEAVERWLFFRAIFDWIGEEIETFRDNFLGAVGDWVFGIGLVMLTLWILLQGYRIVTGQSRQYMMELVVNSLKWVLLFAVATTFMFGGSDVHELLTDDMPALINQMVTGEDEAPEDAIDENLQQMEGAMVMIDALFTSWDETLQAAKTRALWFTGVGVAGPSLIGGAILLMYKMALALFVGLGPFFIMCLGFDQTKGMFQKWLWYGIGTMFSLAVLSFTVSMISSLIGAVSTQFLLQYLAMLAITGEGASAQGVGSMAMQQGGLGILMTLFLITVPAMAASFFQGTLGHFMPHSAFSQQPMQAARPGQPGGGYYPVGGQPIAPSAPSASAGSVERGGQIHGYRY
ncbi:type IV secretion system protein [Luteimonas huabeiensis]|uniref:type IV secretion system protein n=1 Tax=Luteimonas huabeiensis TaxID=1244513 RepID=UPI0004645213|nr:type IV secretion system protein [Luteimonas huabeiensis]